ncbi:MAG: branched-chain amino acid ABC transporter substrate-binding protein, partial [Actinomycetia bacterium]|nr:branched-chain amino acid ABC transporter substrate-binding protein [Actinomycetes bacterium]
KAAGVQFKLVEGDDMSDDKTAVTVANTLISDRNLIGVVGHYNSRCSIPASAIYSEANVVMISPGSTNPDLTLQGLKGVFRTCATDDLQGPAGAMFALDMGLKTAVVMDDSDTYGEGIADFFDEAFVDGGGNVLMREKTQVAERDFTALSTKITAENPDLVFFGGGFETIAPFSKQLHDAGSSAPVMGGDAMAEQDYIDIGGSSVEGDFVTNVGAPVEGLPAAQDFVAAYKDRFSLDSVGNFASYSYDAAFAIMKAAIAVHEEVGDVTSPAGRDALIAAVEKSNFEGVTGTISFNENGDTNNKVISLYKVIDQAWEFVESKDLGAGAGN